MMSRVVEIKLIIYFVPCSTRPGDADPRGLEVRCHGDRSSAAVRLLRRDNGRYYRHSHQRTSHLRVRRPGQSGANVSLGDRLRTSFLKRH